MNTNGNVRDLELKAQIALRWKMIEAHMARADGKMTARELGSLYQELKEWAILHGYEPRK